MSSDQCPRTPPAPSSEVVGAHEDGTGQSVFAMSSALPQATSKKYDPDFRRNHLKLLEYAELSCSQLLDSSEVVAPHTADNPQPIDAGHTPHFPPATASNSLRTTLEQEVQLLLTKIRAVTSGEAKLYPLLSRLLTLLSKAVYGRLDAAEQSAWRARHKIEDRADIDGHIVFIDHHASPLTHYPNYAYTPKDAPDIIGVVNTGDLQCNADKVYSGVPYHRVEAIVEIKSASKDGRSQAASYAYRHQQARPDHPTVYFLSVKPSMYQILLSDPIGVVASGKIDWQADLDPLVSYLYSHYCPFPAHIVYDSMVTWTASGNARPLWTIKCNGQTYTNGKHLFTGDPWGRRTAVFEVKPPIEVYEDKAVIKEFYRHFKRRFKEEDLLEHIHKDGDILGFVRMLDYEAAPTKDGGVVQCGTKEAGTLRTKGRLALKDLGHNFMRARSVHDLLKAVYDVLEVHRTVLMRRDFLHRDVSIYNVLIYPHYGKVERVIDDPPCYIADVLDQKRLPEQRRSAALLIDADHGARVKTNSEDCVSEELKDRTGTPMFIARAVSLGRFLCTSDVLKGFPMPKLGEKALKMYEHAHGIGRYDRYTDPDGNTKHGGRPPPKHWENALWDEDLQTRLPEFIHRAEHDVESAFWTLLAALLRVYPTGADSRTAINQAADKTLQSVWSVFSSHAIPKDPNQEPDPRISLLFKIGSVWDQVFLDKMQGKGLGTLLMHMSMQVLPEYALWETAPPVDHLHEAVQRLIL